MAVTVTDFFFPQGKCYKKFPFCRQENGSQLLWLGPGNLQVECYLLSWCQRFMSEVLDLDGCLQEMAMCMI